MNASVIILLSVTGLVAIVTLFIFLRNLVKYKYLGNKILYIAIAYAICLSYSLVATIMLPKLSAEVAQANKFAAVVSSFFDAVKMMAVAFDRDNISIFFDIGGYELAFAIGYVVASIFGALFASLSIVLTLFKSLFAKGGTLWKRIFTNKRMTYIFTDSKNPAAVKLAEELKKKNIVNVVLTSASQKTQDGTEFKDALVGKGFDVVTENFTKNYCALLLKKHFNKKFKKLRFHKKRQVSIFGIFMDDEISISLAGAFKSAIEENEMFKKLNSLEVEDKVINPDKATKKEIKHAKRIKYYLDRLEEFKVFITYHEADIDLTNHYSSSTLHIVNTLSQYDMISTEFILNNQILNFKELKDFTDEDNKGLNVTFLGLGKINKTIFDKMTSAYQLWNDNINKVNYYILDKNSNEIAAHLNNQYTVRPTGETKSFAAPFLYTVNPACDGLDLSKHEVLNNYIKDEVKDKPNRFTKDGFEIFVISMAKTSVDIETTISLRNALIKNIKKEDLGNAVIFVRLGNEEVAKNFKEAMNENNTIVLDQEYFSSGEYIKDKSREKKIHDTLVPIVIFGENVLMSTFVNTHYQLLDYLGMLARKSYWGIKSLECARYGWLKSNKQVTSSNVGVSYSIATKVELLGFDFRLYDTIKYPDGEPVKVEDIRQIFAENTKRPDYKDEKMINKPLYKLAALEHNRWLASSYNIFKYDQYDVNDFIESLRDKKTHQIAYKKDWSKYFNAKHVCMLTNKDLSLLGDKLDEEAKYQKNGELKKEVEQKTTKMLFETDIKALEQVIQFLPEYQIGKQKKQRKGKCSHKCCCSEK